MGKLSSDQGFSLLELLVAIAILSLAVIPMLATQSTALQSTTILKEKALAKMIADNQLAEFKAHELPPQAGEHSGTAEQAGVSFQWHANVQHISAQNLISISLSVQRTRNSAPVYQITGFRNLL